MRRHTLAALIAPLFLGVGCTNSGPAPPRATTGPTPAPERKDDRDDPVVKEAKAGTEVVLADLLAGKYDDDPSFAPVARRVKGFRAWSIESQRIDPDSPRTVSFGGTLSGPPGEATFIASMTRQQDGRWMIGHFSGPRRK